MARGVPKKAGHTPKVTKLYTGKGKTRPIPLVVDQSDKRRIAAAAADQKSVAKATKMPSGPRVGGVSEIFGTRIRTTGGATYNPASGLDKTI